MWAARFRGLASQTEKVGCAPAFICPCFLAEEAMWPAASHAGHHALPATEAYALKLCVNVNSPFLRLPLSQQLHKQVTQEGTVNEGRELAFGSGSVSAIFVPMGTCLGGRLSRSAWWGLPNSNGTAIFPLGPPTIVFIRFNLYPFFSFLPPCSFTHPCMHAWKRFAYARSCAKCCGYNRKQGGYNQISTRQRYDKRRALCRQALKPCWCDPMGYIQQRTLSSDGELGLLTARNLAWWRAKPARDIWQLEAWVILIRINT